MDFEEKLERTAERLGITVEQIPRHIAIIMDGNGRWSLARGLPRVEGHRRGGKTVERIAQCCVDFGIESLTLYSFSMENWKRPKAEVDALMQLYTQYLVEIRSTLTRNNVKLAHLGRLAGLPPDLQKEFVKTIELTAGNTGMVLALALNYGGRAEIVDATKKIAQEYKNGKLCLEAIDERCISEHLYTAPDKIADPDLLIRTANEMRVSNFLLWQISYSEFYVTKTLWPDFKKASLEKAVLSFAKRDRRFGTIKNQISNNNPDTSGLHFAL
jgi:undecaprenyl diphosphate synthase